MEIEVRRQLLQLAAAFLTGAALGAVYDVFRVLRWRSGKNVLADLLFSAVLCVTLFSLGMSLGDGELGWAMALFAALGFAFYMTVLSRGVLRILNKLAEITARAVNRCLKPVKSGVKFLAELTKKLFFKLRNRFTMVKKSDTEHGAEHNEEKPYGNGADAGGSTAVFGGKSYDGVNSAEGRGELDAGADKGNRNRGKGKPRLKRKSTQHRQ